MRNQNKSHPELHAAAATSDRRAAERFATVREASCSPVTQRENVLTVRVRDVSAHGVGLLAGRRFEKGTILLIQVLGENPALPPMLVGKVVHVTAQPTGDWLIGCRLARGLTKAEVQTVAEDESAAELSE
jgi:hypothetical protein